MRNSVLASVPKRQPIAATVSGMIKPAMLIIQLVPTCIVPCGSDPFIEMCARCPLSLENCGYLLA